MTQQSHTSPRPIPGLSRSTAGVLCLAFAAEVCAQQIARPFLKGPYLQAPGANTMTVMWESPTNKPGLVHYAWNGRLDRELRLETPRELSVVSSNAVTNITVGRTNVVWLFKTNFVFL